MDEKCFHCGDEMVGRAVRYEEKVFCCAGCKTVFLLLTANGLNEFYDLERQPGTKPSSARTGKFDFLDVDEIGDRFIEFQKGDQARTTLFLPSIHCASCIYLLENLSKIDPGIRSCQVNFNKREASITFDRSKLSFSALASLLDRIGYAPNFGNRSESQAKVDRTYLYKLGVAGFAFGSIMLWSFPEYLGIERDNPEFRQFTSYLSLIVSIPVLIYSASDYFKSAIRAIRIRHLNLDVPITIGIVALYFQSLLSILQSKGPGYMDSFAGFIFFLLIGKWFQSKTYRSLSFERDHTAYFPVAVTRLGLKGEEEIVPIEKLSEGDEILVRNDEIIPCDSQLISEKAYFDYSFISGESNSILKSNGDFVHAGGKLRDKRSRLRILRKSDRSQLTRLWNETKKEASESQNIEYDYQNKLSQYFLSALLLIAALSSLVWVFLDKDQIIPVVVAIVIVACPCALALSAPFTYGNIMRVLGRKGLFLKNTQVIERMNDITDIVFDKTGTLTHSDLKSVVFSGAPFTREEFQWIYSLTNSSTHPYSRQITRHLYSEGYDSAVEPESFYEEKGAGISGNFNGTLVRVGSQKFCEATTEFSAENTVYVRISDKIGVFTFSSMLRNGIENLFGQLSPHRLHLISGDTDSDKVFFKPIIQEERMHFRMDPEDKHAYVMGLQERGCRVMMIGDGLNDSGALSVAHVGIALSEDLFRFTPSSDAILEASSLGELASLLKVSNFSKRVLRTCLFFSLSYNIIGLYFACTGQLTPLVAAILMPLSSISVVLISTFLSLYSGRLFFSRKT